MGKRKKGLGRGKKKSASKTSNKETSDGKSNSTSRNRRQRGRGRPKKFEQNWSTSSDGSPFKGFELVCMPSDSSDSKENFECVNLDEKEIIEDKNITFDSLLDPNYRSRFSNKNIKTYSNKKRLSQEKKLEFQDCKNRDSIIQWLTDTRNVFDRLTQTQCNSVRDNDQEVPLSLEMPSVSQVDTRITRSSSKNMKTKKKLRAQSLDIRIKKNGNEGRSKRHSLAGDTPSMENYHIEEVVTDEELPVPAEKIIVDLMEDEYLNNIEKEMMVHVDKEDEKKIQKFKGWDRMKHFNKTINISKKKPKQLKITTLQFSQNEKEGNLMNNGTYNYDELENYFIENMEKLIARNKDSYSYLSGASNFSSNQVFIQNAISTGNNFVNILKKLTEKRVNQEFNELKPVVMKIKEIISKLNLDQDRVFGIATQTSFLETINQEIQTEIDTVSVGVQTEDLEKCQTCANNEIVENNRLPDILLSDKIVQTEGNQMTGEDTHVQEHNEEIRSTVTESTTPSQLSDKQIENIGAPENCDTTNLKRTVVENELESLDICFNTEDIVKASDSQENVINVIENPQKSTELDDRKSGLINECNKGVKRLFPKSPHSKCDELQPKRPCNKFINEDLSVDFMSCSEHEESKSNNKQSKAPNEKVTMFSESSDDVYFEQYLDQVMQKFEDVSSEPEIKPAPTVDKSQEHIEKYEALIHNTTKPDPSAGQNKTQQRPTSCSNSDEIFEAAEITMSNLEKDLDYFKTEKTPKSSRKCLFDSKKSQAQEAHQFSESLFHSDHDETLVGCEEDIANHTITQDNVDALMKECSRDNTDRRHAVDKEVENILTIKAPKVNILQNITLRSANHECTPREEIGLLEDIDIVESTPQKKFGSFSERRAESVLDITLPPPLEFQDVEMVEIENPTTVVKKSDSLRPPLATINKITSTPITQNYGVEKLTLSPITPNRNLNPIEIVQRSKFSPLTIVKKAASQRSFHTTPKQKTILNYMRPSQETQESPQDRSNRACIACSRITREQVMGISAMANRKLASYSSSFSSKVTHMIVSADNRNRIKEHTIKSISAIAAGIWVLSYGWVKECLAKNCIVPEEPYEVLDFSGIPGPKMARLNGKTNPLLKGFKVHVLPPFQAIARNDLENILTLLGARVVNSLEDLLDKENFICLVIGDRRPTEECPVDMFDGLVEVFKVITVDVDWLSRSVGQYSLHGLRPFTLCSEDDIDNLGYPPELLSDSVSISLLQSTSSVPSL